jgi:hypothetical protein
VTGTPALLCRHVGSQSLGTVALLLLVSGVTAQGGGAGSGSPSEPRQPLDTKGAGRHSAVCNSSISNQSHSQPVPTQDWVKVVDPKYQYSPEHQYSRQTLSSDQAAPPSMFDLTKVPARECVGMQRSPKAKLPHTPTLPRRLTMQKLWQV